MLVTMRRSFVLALLGLVVLACRGSSARSEEVPTPPVPTAATATPRGAPTADDAKWASWATPCKTDDECTAVARGCCACGANSYRPVLKAHEADASKSVTMGDCNCPQQQHCNRIVYHCRAGTCSVEES